MKALIAIINPSAITLLKTRYTLSIVKSRIVATIFCSHYESCNKKQKSLIALFIDKKMFVLILCLLRTQNALYTSGYDCKHNFSHNYAPYKKNFHTSKTQNFIFYLNIKNLQIVKRV